MERKYVAYLLGPILKRMDRWLKEDNGFRGKARRRAY
jgi:hypothetical protein